MLHIVLFVLKLLGILLLAVLILLLLAVLAVLLVPVRYRARAERAVAMATPGITVEIRSFRDWATIPASPPKKAINTS